MDDLFEGGWGDDRIVHVERIPARTARHAALARPLPDDVARAAPLPLWTHQAAAIDLARDGHDVVVATGTASGKSLCYHLPIAEAVGATPPGTALLLFPTKALAQDQLRSITALGAPGLVAATYDGDTGVDERTWARRNASVLLSNPDMLHVGVLPYHQRWATFLMRLRYVVVDELHVLRGIFGTHVAHLLRRLRRVCAHYGADPTFLFGSATIGDPASLASELCGKDVVAITDDGSPRGARLFVLWSPPLLDAATGTRGSSNVETASVLARLVSSDRRAIAFCRSRKGTELVAADVARRVPERLRRTVRPYRGGYLAAERREIERELFSGKLRAVVATSALELGIDIGSLDACVLDGYPGTIASMWQQAGRAGRAQQESLAVLVAGQDQLDQWVMTHPHEVFARPPEPAVVNPTNPFVLHPHLACAAYELPLTPDDARFWGDDVEDAVLELVRTDQLAIRNRRAYWAGQGSPAPRVGLRTGSSVEYRIARGSRGVGGDDDGRLIGTVDEARAFEQVHPGAVYLHQGTPWRVRELDLDDRVAYVEPSPGDEHTQVRSEADIRILEVDRTESLPGARLSIGAVEVRERVTGYQRKDVRTGEVLGVVDLDLPPTRLLTRGFWWAIEPATLARARVLPGDWPGTLHATEHAAIGMLPLFTICDRWDVGGVSTALQADTGTPTIVIYDGYPGGAGVAELGFASARELLERTLEVIESCPCATGCPSCVQSPKCGNLNEPLDKPGAAALLRQLGGGVSSSSPRRAG